MGNEIDALKEELLYVKEQAAEYGEYIKALKENCDMNSAEIQKVKKRISKVSGKAESPIFIGKVIILSEKL